MSFDQPDPRPGRLQSSRAPPHRLRTQAASHPPNSSYPHAILRAVNQTTVCFTATKWGQEEAESSIFQEEKWWRSVPA